MLWTLRAVQALSPAALIAFRQLVESEEAACDALAARVTGRPADLASVLLEVERLSAATRRPDDAPGGPAGHLLLLRGRVRGLLDGVAERGPGRHVGWLAAALLAALLWGIG